MYLTQHTDYGLRVLIYTAINDDVLVDISTIAETYNISESHLMKVVTALVKGGFLTSVRGKGGGLKLAEPPEETSIGSVVRHLEPIQLVECIGRDNNCLITPSCRLANILSGGIKVFLNHLDGFTLSDLLNKPTYDLLYTPKVDISVERTNWVRDFHKSSKIAQNFKKISLECNVLYISRELTSVPGFIFHLKNAQYGLNNPLRFQTAFLR